MCLVKASFLFRTRARETPPPLRQGCSACKLCVQTVRRMCDTMISAVVRELLGFPLGRRGLFVRCAGAKLERFWSDLGVSWGAFWVGVVVERRARYALWHACSSVLVKVEFRSRCLRLRISHGSGSWRFFFGSFRRECKGSKTFFMLCGRGRLAQSFVSDLFLGPCR